MAFATMINYKKMLTSKSSISHQAKRRKEEKNLIRLGIDGIVDIFHAHFALISVTFRIWGLRKYHEVRRYSPDDTIDP
jgi:hypothetical protein